MKKLSTSICYLLLYALTLSCQDHRPSQQITCEDYYSRINISRCPTWLLVSKVRNNVESILDCEKDDYIQFQTGRLAGNFIYYVGTISCSGSFGPPRGSEQCVDGKVTLLKSPNPNAPTPIFITQSLEFFDPGTFILKYKDTNGDDVVETYVCQS
jgi:hypothetical protein